VQRDRRADADDVDRVGIEELIERGERPHAGAARGGGGKAVGVGVAHGDEVEAVGEPLVRREVGPDAAPLGILVEQHADPAEADDRGAMAHATLSPLRWR